MPLTLAPVTVPAPRATEPDIRWEMTLETADAVMTMLAASPSPRPDILDGLYTAVSRAADRAAARFDGCEGLFPDADPMDLAGPALLGDTSGDLLAVLVPGHPTAVEAIEAALTLATEAGAEIDRSDTNLVADVSRPRWFVLNTCESHRHDFHPEYALFPTSPGAVPARLVTLSWI